MTIGRKARDIKLLDALDALAPVSFEGRVWRAAWEGRDPLQGHPSGGRWDPGTFDVLYTSLDAHGAVAEIHFHLSRQPVFPSKIRVQLHEIVVKTARTLRFADLGDLASLGVEEAHYRDVLYEKTRAIGDAADFLGFDGIIAPNARWRCLNLVIFTDRVAPGDIAVASSSEIKWPEWREKIGRKSD